MLQCPEDGFSLLNEEEARNMCEAGESSVRRDIVLFISTLHTIHIHPDCIPFASMCFLYMLQFIGGQGFPLVQTEDDLKSQMDHHRHKS